ncbi:MAG: hypothetical protein IJ853_03735 [Rickettsiales bacterium]|nr:hypothetical protein [Rickettsiales bacterium]
MFISILILFIVIFSNSTYGYTVKSNIELQFYKDYVFSNKLNLNINTDVFDSYNIGGNISKNSMDGDTVVDILNNINNYKMHLNSIQTDNDNYFYNIYITKYFNMKDNMLALTLLYRNVIEYNELLKFTYADVYKSIMFGFNYFKNDIPVPINVFTYFSKNINGIKDNLLMGIGTNYKFNDTLSFYFEYSYFRDISDKDTVALILQDIYLYFVDVDVLLYKAHNFKLVTTVDFNKVTKVDLTLGYSIADRYSNNAYFNVSIKL